MINFWTLSLDWTKIYANASKNKNTDEKYLEKKIKSLMEEADKIDSIEDWTYWENNENTIPEELKTVKLREIRKEEVKKKELIFRERQVILKKKIEKKKEQWINQTRINSTDEDSRLMKMKRKDWWNGYNPQNITENQFVISTNISNNSNDTNELIPSIKKLERQYWILPNKLLADSWYGTEQNYEYNEKMWIKSYIPHPEYRWTNIDHLIYDEKEDIYTDEKWNIFKFTQHFWRIKWEKQKWKASKSEDFTWKRYMAIFEDWKKKHLQVAKNLKEIFKRNDKRLYSEEWKEIYRKRSWDVEVPFWNIKFNLWFERFNLRWFSGVEIEWNLINMVHNIGKLIKFWR
jgi:hypothetical protein